MVQWRDQWNQRGRGPDQQTPCRRPERAHSRISCAREQGSEGRRHSERLRYSFRSRCPRMRDRAHEFANRRDRLWTHTSTSQERWIEHPRRVRRPGRTTTYPDQPEYQWHTYQHGKSRRRPPGKLARTFQAPKPTPESSDPLHHRNRPQPQAGHHQRCSHRAVAKGRQFPSLVMLALQHRPGQAHRCPRRLMRTCTSRIQCPMHCMLEHRSPPGRGTLELYPERTRYSAVRRQNMHRRDTPERSSRRGCYSSWRRSFLTSLPLLRVVSVHS